MNASLSPLWIRLLVFAVMAAIAVGSIWLIDRRAMQRMDEMQSPPSHTNALATNSDAESLSRIAHGYLTQRFTGDLLSSVGTTYTVHDEGEQWIVEFDSPDPPGTTLGGGAKVHIDKQTREPVEAWLYQ